MTRHDQDETRLHSGKTVTIAYRAIDLVSPTPHLVHEEAGHGGDDLNRVTVLARQQHQQDHEREPCRAEATP